MTQKYEELKANAPIPAYIDLLEMMVKEEITEEEYNELSQLQETRSRRDSSMSEDIQFRLVDE